MLKINECNEDRFSNPLGNYNKRKVAICKAKTWGKQTHEISGHLDLIAKAIQTNAMLQYLEWERVIDLLQFQLR